MLKSLRKTLAIAGASLMLSLAPAVALVPSAVYAADDEIGDCLSQGSGLDASIDDGCTATDTDTGTQKIQDIVTLVVNIFSVIVGIVAVEEPPSSLPSVGAA